MTVLTLSILRCPDGVPPETRLVPGSEFSIGRDPKNDWVLPDPDRFLSKRHCVLSLGASGWQITDTSTNGTFLNHEIEPIRDTPRGLRDDDRILLGGYEIEVSLQDADEPLYRPARTDAAGDAARWQPDRRQALPGGPGHTDDRMPGDPFPPSATDPLGLAVGGPIALPERYDPLAPAAGLEDDAPVVHDPAFLDARYRPPRSPAELLPDDWDAPDDRDAKAPSATPPAMLPAPVPPPPPAPVAPRPLPPAPVPAPPPAASSPATASSEAGVPSGAGADAGFAAFLRGVGIQPQQMPPADTGLATLQALGGAFRAMVQGLRRIMIGRAAIKGEFRIEQTMIRASGNNPLKFSADDEDALAALLNLGRRSDLSPEAAVADALRDVRLHEVAMMAAMREAVGELLGRFDPGRLLDAGGGHPLDAWPSRRKARGWDAFEAQHRHVVGALSDDFDSVFGKAFARAYERTITEARATPDDAGHSSAPGRPRPDPGETA